MQLLQLRNNLIHNRDFACKSLMGLNLKYKIHIYPGVPLVSDPLFNLHYLETPKSVILRYPF